ATLDTNGAETSFDVLADGFEYRRPDLVSMSGLELLVRDVIRRFQDQILENTLHTQSVDWDGMRLDHKDRASIGTLPAIALVGPRLPKDTHCADPTPTYRRSDDGSVSVLRAGYSVSVAFEIFVYARLVTQLLGLQAAITSDFDATPWLYTRSA